MHMLLKKGRNKLQLGRQGLTSMCGALSFTLALQKTGNRGVTPLILSLGCWRQEDQKIRVLFIYIVSVRLAWAI